MAHDLPLRGAQRIGRVDLGNPHARHTGPRRNRHDPKGRKEQQDDLTDLTDPRPDDDQRDQGQGRHGAHEFHNRVKPPAEPVGQTHCITQRNTHQSTKHKAHNDAEERITKVLGQGRVAIPDRGNFTQTAPDRFR